MLTVMKGRRFPAGSMITTSACVRFCPVCVWRKFGCKKTFKTSLREVFGIKCHDAFWCLMFREAVGRCPIRGQTGYAWEFKQKGFPVWSLIIYIDSSSVLKMEHRSRWPGNPDLLFHGNSWGTVSDTDEPADFVTVMLLWGCEANR